RLQRGRHRSARVPGLLLDLAEAEARRRRDGLLDVAERRLALLGRRARAPSGRSPRLGGWPAGAGPSAPSTDTPTGTRPPGRNRADEGARTGRSRNPQAPQDQRGDLARELARQPGDELLQLRFERIGHRREGSLDGSPESTGTP